MLAAELPQVARSPIRTGPIGAVSFLSSDLLVSWSMQSPGYAAGGTYFQVALTWVEAPTQNS